MEFNEIYPWFWLGMGAFVKPRHEFVPIRFTQAGEVLRDSSRRSTLRMQWRVTADPDGGLSLRAAWDARRRMRTMGDQT
jgi:hypothetical protein